MSTAPMPHRAAGPPPQRLGAGAALTLGVLLVHAWLVGPAWRESSAMAAPPSAPSRAVQVRQIVPAAAPAGLVPDPVPTPAPFPVQTAVLPAVMAQRVQPQTTPTPDRDARVSGTIAAVAATGSAPTPAQENVDADPHQPAAAAAPASPASADADYDGAPVPTYATRPPAAATLTYLWQRGAQQGQAQLRWVPRENGDGSGGYELVWVAQANGGPALGGFSRGSFDSAGLAPERHVERRRGRDVRATSFDRDNGHISFSSSPRQVALPAGVQDRLSWMLQLPAMFEADPALATAGTELQMVVAGARGQVGVWTFTVVGAESLQLPIGETSATLHLQRLARRPYDTQVDVWLDPARGHLPVRLRLAAPPAPGASEWLLQSLTTP